MFLFQSQRWQKIYARLVEVLSGVPFENIIQVLQANSA